MFSGIYKIQYASAFALFLVWFLNNLPHTFFHIKNATKKNRSRNAVTNTDLGSSEPDSMEGYGDKSIYDKRSKLSNRYLYDGLILLTLGVILNHIGQGDRSWGDVFALIAMFSLVINAILHWVGIAVGGHILWLLAHLSLLGLFLTPWCTHYTRIAF